MTDIAPIEVPSSSVSVRRSWYGSMSPRSRGRCFGITQLFIIIVGLLLLNIMRFNEKNWYSPRYSSVRFTQRHSSATAGNETTSDKRMDFHIPRTDRCSQRVETRYAGRVWAKKLYSNRNDIEACTFTPIEEGGPIPTIFLVNGRSGSDVTWATITTLAGKVTPIGEHTGENKVKAMEFLGSMTAEEGAWWITEHMCEFTRRYCDAPIAGFKWKPFADSWVLPSSQAILKKIASFDKPRIRVIFMTRNPLDVMISKFKHKRYDMKAHCTPEDEECLKKAEKRSKGLRLPTETLLQDLNYTYAGFDLFESQLKELGIMHIKVTYEELYEQDHAEEWMRIFRFLGRGPKSNLSIDEVRKTLKYATTFAKFHNETLSNYDEVQERLSGTVYEALLH